MKGIVITGPNGFVGTHIMRELRDAGYYILAIARDREEDMSAFDGWLNLDVVYLDLKEIVALPDRVKRDKAILARLQSCDSLTFLHMAWMASAGQGRADHHLQLNNVRYSCDAVAAAAGIGCKRFVGAGSIMEDECIHYVPLDGVEPAAAYQYSSAKLTTHLMCKTLAAQLGLEFCWGKISNAYGEGDRTNRFVNTIWEKMRRGEPCSFTPAEQNYDFIYVSEVARAFRCILEKGVSFSSYYIGSGAAGPLKDFILQMHKATGQKSSLDFGAVPFAGISLGMDSFSAEKLRRDTGFTCQISFEQGLQKMLELSPTGREK